MNNLLFNARDRKLLDQLPSQTGSLRSKKDAHLFNYHLHPRGIKELVNPKGIRVANLMRNLLDTLEEGRADDRLQALHSLRDEVFYSAQGAMNRNTARALLSVMKELLREDEDEPRRLELAYEFHSILTGKPAVVRKFLKRYHLLEMPEEWNQLTFDHHVHDAHTKGRKSPTHLIMDAWIKGIRKLTVIYYDYIPTEAARELLSAAAYMEIDVRIGVELVAEHRNKPVSLIWIPRGFAGTEDFLRFLERKEVRKFMKAGRQVSGQREGEVFHAFTRFNEVQRPRFNEAFDLFLPALKEEAFRDFVGTGQASLLHLSEFIHTAALPLLKERAGRCGESLAYAAGEERAVLKDLMDRANRCTSEYIFDTYFREGGDPGLEFPSQAEGAMEWPTPDNLIETLDNLHPGYRLTLNLTGLQAEDVLELVYLCGGRIDALEIYNHKDWAQGLDREIPRIRSFQHPLNEGNTIALKRAILSLIGEVEEGDQADRELRAARLHEILKNLPSLLRYYEVQPLRDRWGSDSTGRSNQLFGMGLAVMETLPKKAQREIRRGESSRILPIHIPTKLRRTYVPSGIRRLFTGGGQRNDGAVPTKASSVADGREWIPQEYSADQRGLNNVVALGWRPPVRDNGFNQSCEAPDRSSLSYRWRFLNTNVKNVLKILIGFIPAFLTFALTKDWWVLAYLGAPIWFGITGFRNILQSVLGGDGLRRSPLLPWSSYVNWSRVSDSLLYTGFSVPLLDFLVKQVILNHGFGINTSTNVLALYGFMALVNGIYISSHNFFRGLPPGAIAGNFFRSILSIPLAIAFNFLLEGLLSALGVAGVALILQKWAAVISKAASDCVAGLIEGTADRNRNISLRRRDYRRKIEQMYTSFVKMELLLPQTDVLQLLADPKKLTKTIKIEDPELLRSTIYDALDLLYFWLYQPHARTVLKRLVKRMPPEERLIFLRFQHVLERRKMISNLFLDGLLGRNFAKALAFYLSRTDSYLSSMDRLLTR